MLLANTHPDNARVGQRARVTRTAADAPETASAGRGPRPARAGVLLAALLISASAGAGNAFCARVLEVVDAQQLLVATAAGVRRVRLIGIASPQPDQPFGREAQARVRELLSGRVVRVVDTARDDRGRLLANVWTHAPHAPCRSADCPLTLDVGMLLLSVGLAWPYPPHGACQDEETRSRYADEEHEARARRAGLWNTSDPVSPWQWHGNALDGDTCTARFDEDTVLEHGGARCPVSPDGAR